MLEQISSVYQLILAQINSFIEKALSYVYSFIEWTLEKTGGVIPDGDNPVFALTTWVAGWSVSVDAIIMEAVVLPLVPKKLWLPIIFLITMTHAFAGYLGLAVLTIGEMLGITLGFLLVFTCYMGLKFIIGCLISDEEEEPDVMKNILLSGIFAFAAFVLYWEVSFDEFFMVLQRFQWMVSQGWNEIAMAVNIGLSMIVLFLLQCVALVLLLVCKPFTRWVNDHGDYAMFVVFSLIMYYLVRGVIQNGLELYVPYEIPYTGISPELLTLGFVLTWFLQKVLENKTVESFARAAFFIKKDEIPEESAVS